MPKKSLPDGKLPIDLLERILRPLNQNRMIVSPKIGIDVGISKSHGKFIVSSSDPITGTRSRMGWHGVNVSANDVATSGIMPELINMVALFPSNTSAKEIEKVISEIDKTASKLGITVAGGHTEVTSILKAPLIIITAIGSGSKFVTAAGAKKGDSILMTKTAGIEGTSILSKLSKVMSKIGSSKSHRGASLVNQISVLDEASHAFKTGKVHAMHDVTEGGVLGAVYEMSLASNLGFTIQEDLIPVDESTRALCEKLSIDPLRLIGSGSLIIACQKSSSGQIIANLKSRRIKCTEIGSFTSQKNGRFLQRGYKFLRITRESIQDELWDALRKYGDSS